MKAIPYLTFNGNCREAMRFYKKCLGGTLSFQTLGESPLAAEMPVRMKRAILHATLVSGHLTLVASDMVSESGLKKGNAVSIFLHCDTEKQIQTVYKKLAENGIKNQLPRVTPSSSIMGELTDKYGNNWLLYYKTKEI